MINAPRPNPRFCKSGLLHDTDVGALEKNGWKECLLKRPEVFGEASSYDQYPARIPVFASLRDTDVGDFDKTD